MIFKKSLRISCSFSVPGGDQRSLRDPHLELGGWRSWLPQWQWDLSCGQPGGRSGGWTEGRECCIRQDRLLPLCQRPLRAPSLGQFRAN